MGCDGTLDSNLPYRSTAQGRWLIAVLRPDRREESSRRLRGRELLWGAATLAELHELRRAWGDFVRRTGPPSSAGLRRGALSHGQSAEEEGFEPPDSLRRRLISSQMP
jgi:hypothetical protein